MSLKTVFCSAIAAQVGAILAQAFLAGSALSGNEPALRAHMVLGVATLLASAVQAITAFLLTRAAQIPKWLVGASIAFLVADAVQMAAGRLQLFSLHLPLGVALFGAAAALGIYAWGWRPEQRTELQEIRPGGPALNGLLMEEKKT